MLKQLFSFLMSIFIFITTFGGLRYETEPGEKYSAPFSTDSQSTEAVDIVTMFNGVCALFGTDTSTALVQQFGNEAAYFNWMAKKAMWTDDTAFKDELKEKIVNYPMTDTGYLWSWATSTYWPTGRGDMHYDGLFQYISAVYEIISWENSTEFLNSTDTDTYGNDAAVDASQGKTVYEKCNTVMSYILGTLDGRNGVITIKENSVYLADGKTRFDINENGENIWNNTGCFDSASSNYWDNFCFGNIDAYETVLFYEAVNSMQGIEKALGNTEKAAEYKALSEKIHSAFDRYFWDSDTGRYIGCIDTEGNRHDYGFTFLNTYALAVGLGDGDKAESIFSWINGDRIVDGDTSTGSDITDYTAFLNDNIQIGRVLINHSFVPRSSTVSIESKAVNGSSWWESLEGGIQAEKGGNAQYGTHLENGGIIFWTLYYELSAYCRYGDTERLLKRLGDTAEVYRYNGFDSDAGNWAEGLIGEFPENGIVNRVLLTDIMGISADGDYLVLSPDVPEIFGTLAVDEFVFGENTFSAKVSRNSLVITAESSTDKLPVVFRRENTGSVTAVFSDTNGNTVYENTFEKNANGDIIIDGCTQSFSTVEITFENHTVKTEK